MIDVYVDESGDLGFSAKSPKYFIISYVILQCREGTAKKVKRLLKDINLHHKRRLTEFRFTQDSDYIRHKFLNLISKQDIEVGQIVVKKTAVRQHLRDSKSLLYNYLIAENITRTLVNKYEKIDHVNLHLDLSMSKGSRDHFDNYFSDKLSWVSQITKNPSNVTNHVFHDYSHHEPCVQIADYIAGALYQMHEHGDDRYYEMIKNKILYTNAWGISIE